MFDGSSIPGWKGIEDSDMLMHPDLTTAVMDPFTVHPTLNIICDVIEPTTGEGYPRDPRSLAQRAEKYVIERGIADTAYFGPEPEFLIKDDVRYGVEMNKGYYFLDSSEGPYNSGREEANGGNLGFRTDVKGGYFPVGPVDQLHDMRAEMLSTMKLMGLEIEKHHHEVAPSQHELGFKFSTLVNTADHLQIDKYVIKNVAQIYGKTATFMPKPIYKDNGSGMHVHQSLWKKGALFSWVMSMRTSLRRLFIILAESLSMVRLLMRLQTPQPIVTSV